MATKKAGGAVRLGRDSNPQYLGVKVGDGQPVHPGMILVRQRGTRIHPGQNVRRAVDDTLFAVASGSVKFQTKKRKRFDGKLKTAKYVHVQDAAAQAVSKTKATAKAKAKATKKKK
jgi:large subunit ribosomal protein L27